jgi:hypothetical protein
MREAGVNVMKLYAGNPAENAGGPGQPGKWKEFLDYCWNNGNTPVYVIMFSYTQGGVIAQGGAGLDRYITDYQKLVESTVNHPAVFGYITGNEIFGGVTGNPQFWANFGKLIDAAEDAGISQARNRSSRLRPTTSSRRKWVGRPSILGKVRQTQQYRRMVHQRLSRAAVWRRQQLH